VTIRFELQDRVPLAGGQSFGESGCFERILGRVHLDLDPAAVENQLCFDIRGAERTAAGTVRVSTDLWLIRPTRADGAGRRLVFDLLNRGNKRSVQFFNDAVASNDPRSLDELGHGFLQRRGFSVAACAWQGDVLPGDGRMVIDLPLIRPAGLTVTAPIRAEFLVDKPGTTSLPLSGKNGTHSYAAVSLDTTQAHLVRRRYPGSEPVPIQPHRWRFATVQGNAMLPGHGGDVTGAEQGIVASPRHIYLPEGFEPGWIYELTYTVQDPLAVDLGFLAVREVAAFLRSDATDNPLRGQIDHAYCWGRSQSGRAIRDFLHRGFNAAAGGGRVFDGMLPHISGAGKTAMNRFANLVVAASRQYEDQLNPSDRFPFSYASSRDHLTGTTDAILTRPDTDPLVIHTQSASEYWNRRGSLVHTDTQGHDLAQPASVRIYAWTSSQHWSDPLPKGPIAGPHLYAQNVVATSAFFRAMLVLLDDWVSNGIEPPESRVPRRADGTLVNPAEWRAGFPAIPGVALPQGPNTLCLVDHGSEFRTGGAIAEPPIVSPDKPYAVLVPAVDETGNDRAGLLAPMVQAPLATYTGWNIRARGHGHGMLHDFSGSTIPLPDTADERIATGDPRLSIEERYTDQAGYTAAIRRAADRLAAERFLLEEDIDRAATASARWYAPRHNVALPG
jgi:hypothetical protein